MQKQKIEFPYILHPASPNDNNLQNHNIPIKRRRLIKLLIQLQTLFGLHPGGSDSKESACSAGDLGSISGSERSPRERNGYPLQYSCQENSVDRGAWRATVHGVAKSRTRLSDFTFTFHALEKEMATHSSILAWKNPWTGEPGGLQSMRSQKSQND